MSDAKGLEELVKTTLQQIKKGVDDSGAGKVNITQHVKYENAKPVTETGGTAVGVVEFEVEFDVHLPGSKPAEQF